MKTYRQIAEELEATLLALATGKVASWSLNGKTVTEKDITQLEALYSKYRALAFKQENGNRTIARYGR